jgi:PRC-barrel domain
MPESSSRQDKSEGIMDKAADRVKETTGSLTGDKGKTDEGSTDVGGEERNDRFSELEEAYKDYTVYDRNYEKIGRVDDLFVDVNDQLEYIGVKMGFLLDQKSVLIPMEIVRINDRRKLVEVAANKDAIQEAPSFDNNKEITPEYERRVHGYFGVEHPGSSPERGGYGDYYPSGFTGEHHEDQALGGVDTEYGERTEPQGRRSVGTGDRTGGDLGELPSRRAETAGPRSDLAGTGEAARTGGSPQRGAEEREGTSVRVYKRIR